MGSVVPLSHFISSPFLFHEPNWRSSDTCLPLMLTVRVYYFSGDKSFGVSLFLHFATVLPIIRLKEVSVAEKGQVCQFLTGQLIHYTTRTFFLRKKREA